MHRALAVSLIFVVQAGAPGQEQSPESKILDQWTGTWKTEFVNKRAEWNETETKTNGTVTCKWVLGRKFVQEAGSSLGKDVKHQVLWGYDPQRKAYRYWFFDSNGTTGDGVGIWDENSKTMTWKTDPGAGFIGTASHRFLNADSYEWTYVIKDTANKVYLDYVGKHTRVKK